MTNNLKTVKTTATPTFYRYCAYTGTLLTEIAIGDVDNGVVVTAEHIAALHDSDLSTRRQELRHGKHSRKANPIDYKLGEPSQEDNYQLFRADKIIYT